jgi:hypothetical protein
MKGTNILIFLLIVICGFSSSYKSSLFAASAYKSDSLSNRIVIINAFDAMSSHIRKNKKELFSELADSLKQYLYNEIMYRKKGIEVDRSVTMGVSMPVINAN